MICNQAVGKLSKLSESMAKSLERGAASFFATFVAGDFKH